MHNYTIAYKGLGPGAHDFEFRVDGGLFEAFENSEVKGADCGVRVRVTKGARGSTTGSDMEITVAVEGTVTVACDRCLGDVEVPIEAEDVYDEPINAGQDVIDLTQFVYETVVLALPFRRVHEEGACDPDMMGRFKSEES